MLPTFRIFFSLRNYDFMATTFLRQKVIRGEQMPRTIL